MQYLAALLFILIVAAGGGMVFTDFSAVSRLGLIEQDEGRDTRKREEVARPPVSQPSAAPEQTAPVPFDIAKIDPQGTSVFAGRSVPNSSVTVFADGTAIGSANTDENGEWVLVLERPLPNPDAKLTVQIGSVAPSTQPAPEPPATATATANATPDLRSADAVSARLMDDLRRRVEQAKADAQQQESASEPATQPDVTAERLVSEVPVATADAAADTTARADVLPVPMKFVFREAQFTGDGAKAAQLLLDYLLLKKPPVITMTGHADERGTAEFNMKLSADRLATVSSFLRAGGYTGRIELLPKGDLAPFRGVDRSVMPRDQLYELDRRVELQISD